MSSESYPDSEATMATTKAKKSKKPKLDPDVKAKANVSAHEVLGESLSTIFLSTIHASQDSISTIMNNLGSPPPVIDTESFSASQVSLARSDQVSRPSHGHRKEAASKFDGCSYSLRDFAALDVFETLLKRYGTASHMGVRDQSYSFFINRHRTGALTYKVLDSIAVVTGDPLCCPTEYVALLHEFEIFAKSHHCGVAVMAASDDMACIAHQEGWISMQFALEKVLNPLTNPLLLGTGGKRTVTKCKQLLKSGMTVPLYCPAYQNDANIEAELVRIYEEWCAARNKERGASQAYMTVFDIMSLPRLMAFVYTNDTDNRINGFAALRKIGQGFHVDPFIAAPDAPRGTSDLLLYSAMALSKTAGISRLSLGFEPLPELGEIVGMPKIMVGLTRKVHRRIFGTLPLDGKRTFFERFHADEEQDIGLHIIFLQRPGPRHMLAMMHFANISLRAMMAKNVKQRNSSKDRDEEKEGKVSSDGNSGSESSTRT